MTLNSFSDSAENPDSRERSLLFIVRCLRWINWSNQNPKNPCEATATEEQRAVNWLCVNAQICIFWLMELILNEIQGVCLYFIYLFIFNLIRFLFLSWISFVKWTTTNMKEIYLNVNSIPVTYLFICLFYSFIYFCFLLTTPNN